MTAPKPKGGGARNLGRFHVLKAIKVDIAPGELIDKITILEIKLERIDDQKKLMNVRTERDILTSVRDTSIQATDELDALTQALKEVNEKLWECEDDIRECESNKDFGEKFIELARTVYITNDKRAALKREINLLLGSPIIEEKSYTAY